MGQVVAADTKEKNVVTALGGRENRVNDGEFGWDVFEGLGLAVNQAKVVDS